MYALPQSTLTRKWLQKKILFAKFDLTPQQREAFDADVARMDIVAEVSPDTVPAIAVGERVKKFYVVVVQLKQKKYSPRNIELLVKLIPQNIIFALQFGEEVQLALHCTRIVATPWQTKADTAIALSGLNMDAVWDNIVATIGGITPTEGKSIAEQIVANDAHDRLVNQIAVLEHKARTESQPRRKLELFEKIKKLKEQL